MAQRLSRYYEEVKAAGGIQAQMRLAMTTGISSIKAATEPDAPETLAKFKAAFKEITGKDVTL